MANNDNDDDYVENLIYLCDRARIPKRILKDIENPLEIYDEEQFFNRYRFCKAVFLNKIFPLVEHELETFTSRGLPKLAVLKALTVLRFFATGNYQIDTGDLHGMRQPVVCQLVKKMSRVLSSHLPKFVKFPSPGEMGTIQKQFYRVSHFPGVVGCIDCTHIPIQNPARIGGENYRNRKGQFSINVQVIAGPNLEILDIVARWPGSAHDSRIFNNSSIKLKFDQRQVTGILLGDSGYAQTHYLYTPFLEPEGSIEERYNKSHTATRCIVERLFGIWKRRFSCLRRKLANNVTTVLHIISACAVLHNIAVNSNEQQPPELETQEGIDEPTVPPAGSNAENRRGIIIKRAFAIQHFNK